MGWLYTLVVALLLSASTAAHAEPPRIDLDVHRASLGNLVRMLAEVSELNIVVGEELSQLVSVRLRNVSAQTALSVILASHGYELISHGQVARVVRSEDVVSRQEREIALRKSESAARPKRTRVMRVSHARAADLVELVRATLSEGATVSVDERTNTLIVRD